MKAFIEADEGRDGSGLLMPYRKPVSFPAILLYFQFVPIGTTHNLVTSD